MNQIAFAQNTALRKSYTSDSYLATSVLCNLQEQLSFSFNREVILAQKFTEALMNWFSVNLFCESGSWGTLKEKGILKSSTLEWNKRAKIIFRKSGLKVPKAEKCLVSLST